MSAPPRVLRVDETKEERAARLRREMHAVGETPLDEKAASEAALAKERSDYMGMPLSDVLEREIKTLLALPTTGEGALWAKDRQQVIKAGVGLMLARAKMGQQWGEDFDDEPEDDE